MQYVMDVCASCSCMTEALKLEALKLTGIVHACVLVPLCIHVCRRQVIIMYSRRHLFSLHT